MPLSDAKLRWLHSPAGRQYLASAKPRRDRRPAAPTAGPCLHLGGETGATVVCPTCQGKVRLKLFACALFGVTVPTRKVDGVASCQGCVDYQAKEPPP